MLCFIPSVEGMKVGACTWWGHRHPGWVFRAAQLGTHFAQSAEGEKKKTVKGIKVPLTGTCTCPDPVPLYLPLCPTAVFFSFLPKLADGF